MGYQGGRVMEDILSRAEKLKDEGQRHLIVTGNFLQARSNFNELLRMQKEFKLPYGEALCYVGDVDLFEGKISEGLKKYDEAVRLYPADLKLLFKRADAKVRFDKEEEALVEFDKIGMLQYSNVPTFWAYRAELYESVGNSSEVAKSSDRAKHLEAQQKKSSPPSSSLSSSPSAQSSDSNSSGEFKVSPDLSTKMTLEERKQKEEFIRAAQQEIPKIVRQMREVVQADLARIEAEIKVLPVKKAENVEVIQRINRALKDAKIPEAVELDTLKQHKQKGNKKVSYLKGKNTLEELLIRREAARTVIAECEETLAKSGKKDVGVYALSLFDKLRFEMEDFEILYQTAKPVIASKQGVSYRDEIFQIGQVLVREKLAALRQADVVSAQTRLIELQQQKDALFQRVANHAIPAAKAQVLEGLASRKQHLQGNVDHLNSEKSDKEQQIRREEGYLRNAGIPVGGDTKRESTAGHAGRFGLHKSSNGQFPSSYTPSTSQASSNSNSRSFPK